MHAAYAVHKRLENLIPEQISRAYQTRLSATEVVDEVHKRPGLIPVSVSAEEGYIVWLDMLRYPFTERQFCNSVAGAVQQQGAAYSFISRLDVLQVPDVITDGLSPDGFIFHMSRCGSTLLARSLSKNKKNIVLNEATPLHENLWQVITDNWQTDFTVDETKSSYIRSLLLAIGRPRVAGQNRYFVKFRSWSIAFIKFIMQAFPTVPCIFVYRDPVEVMVSAKRRPPEPLLRIQDLPLASFITKKSLDTTRNLAAVDYLSLLYENYLQAALQADVPQLQFLNYTDVKKDNLSVILQKGLNYSPTPEELAVMQTQFDFYSKDNSDKVAFVSDRKSKQAEATQDMRVAAARMQGLTDELDRSPKNLARFF
jgi:hypothetical protein